MQELDRPGYLPDLDRISLLAATILLAYALAHYIDLPSRQVALQLPGIYLSVTINVNTFAALLVAGLTATGADWLIRDHPALGKQPVIQHWMMPALTAWVIELPLFQLPISPYWWIGFAMGGLLITLVLIAEYIVVDPDDIRQPIAAAGLTALSFALYLVLAAALRFSDTRLFLVLPALTLGIILVSLRSLYLRLNQWALIEAGIIGLVCAQLAAALHYWPLSPVSYGLILLGPAYALTNLFGNLAEGEPLRQALVEPLVVLALVWGAAFWIR